MAETERTVIGDWFCDVSALSGGVLAAGTAWRPSAADGGAEVPPDQVAEVLVPEIISPVDLAGATLPLERISFIIDEKPTVQYVNLCGRRDCLVFPPLQYHANRAWLPFGRGIVDLATEAMPAIRLGRLRAVPGGQNTTLKVKRSIRPVVEAGATDITSDFRIRLSGYKYKADELQWLVGYSYLDPTLTILDPTRKRTFSKGKNPILINRDNWDRLPGGANQDKPIIMPYITQSENQNATSVNLPYQFRFDTVANVPNQEANLYWAWEQQSKALLIKGLGIRAVEGGDISHLKYVWINVTTDPLHAEHPQDKQTVWAPNDNPFHYGLAYPYEDIKKDLWWSIPRFCGDNLLIWGDLAWLAVQDDGTPVAANNIRVVLNGVICEW